jgi:tellurite resistance protein TerC
MHSVYAWIFFILLILSLLVIDLGLFHGKERRMTFKAAFVLSVFYISLALLFNLGIYFNLGKKEAYDFLTGYLIEKSLSIDNLFVFVWIFKQFSVQAAYQHRILFFGILCALVLRMLLIWTGISLIASVKMALLFFGALLIFTGVKMLWIAIYNKENHLEKAHFLIQWLSKHLPVDKKTKPKRFFIKHHGKWHMTSLFLVLLLIEVSDVLFALDSIPAIFAITQDPFIVYTSNIFAILGLRAFYFSLHHTIERFVFVKHAISLILIFVGVKLSLNSYFKHEIITTEYTLGFIVIIMSMAIFFSVCKRRPV